MNNLNPVTEAPLLHARGIAPIVLAGIIAGVSAIASAGISAAGNARASRRAYRNEIKLADYNTEKNIELYERYQSPAAQMAQYRAAGLNPNLIYGQSLSGPSAGQASYNSDMDYNPEKDIAAGLMNALNMYQQFQFNDAKISHEAAAAESLRVKAALDESRITAQNIANDFSAIRNEYQKEALTQENAMRAIDLDIKQRYGAIRAKQELENLIAQGELTKQQKINAEKQIEVYDQQISESVARVRNMQQQIALGFGQLDLANRQFAEVQDMNFHKRTQDYADWTLRNKDLNLKTQQFQFEQTNKIVDQLMKYSIPKGNPLSADFWYPTWHGKQTRKSILSAYHR